MPRNVQVTPGNGELTVTWDPPADLGNPGSDVIQYLVQIRPTGGWDCDDPDTGRPYTGDEDDLPFWVEAYCTYDGDASPAGFYSPEGGWHTRHFNRAGPEDHDPYSFTFGSLENGVEHEVRVRAEGQGDEAVTPGPGVVAQPPLFGPWSDEVRATPSATGPAPAAERLPGVPRNLLLLPGDQLLTALWEAPSDQGSPALDGYVVRWREVTTPESDWTEFVTESADTELDELVNDQEYQVQVAAYHNTAVDAPAGVRVVTILDAGEVPAPPAGEQPLAECPTDSQPTADCYVVLQAGNIGPYTGVAAASPRALAQEDIVADDPGMPRNLRLTPGVGQITARWDAPSEPDPGHAGYALQYRAEGAARWLDGARIVYGDTDNDPDTPDFEETQENRSAVITGLEGRAYQVRVASLIAEGAGHVAGSFTAPRTVEAVAPRPPGPPRNLAAVTRISPNDGSRRIEVSWDPPTDTGNPAGITGYAVQYRKADAAAWTGWKRPGGESPTGTKATIAGVGPGAYAVRVAAIGALGNTGEYATAGEAQRRPTKVLNLTLTPGDGRIKAEWDAPQDPGSPPIGGYHVSYREDHSPTWQSAAQSGTSRIITGLSNGQLYPRAGVGVQRRGRGQRRAAGGSLGFGGRSGGGPAAGAGAARPGPGARARHAAEPGPDPRRRHADRDVGCPRRPGQPGVDPLRGGGPAQGRGLRSLAGPERERYFRGHRGVGERRDLHRTAVGGQRRGPLGDGRSPCRAQGA